MAISSSNYHLSVITTTDPKAGLLPVLVRELVSLANEQLIKIEIIVVDDLAHLNNSPPIQLSSEGRCVVTLVRQDETKGQLAAALVGINAAAGEFIVTIDPDMHKLVSHFPRMLDQMKTGNTIMHAVRVSRHISTGRRIGSYITNFMIASSTGSAVCDLNSPLIMLRRTFLLEFLRSVPANINPRLYLYAVMGGNIKEYRVGCPDKSGVSQYSIFMLITLFSRLTLDCFRLFKLRLSGKLERA